MPLPLLTVANASPRKVQSLRLLVVGDLDHSEFASARSTLQAAEATFVSKASPKKKIPKIDECLHGLPPWDLVVAFQSRPDSFPARWMNRARQQMPLAGLVTLLGSWCEGEQRTGEPLPFCERIFWYQFAPWWKATHQAWQAGEPTSWQNTPFASQGQTPQSPRYSSSSPQLIAIDSPDVDTAETLLTTCRDLGYSACWSPDWRTRPLTSAPVAGIWVGGQLDEREEERLARFRQTLPTAAPLVALLDFPRQQRVKRAYQLGATSVLGKPWRMEQLASLLTPPAIAGDML